MIAESLGMRVSPTLGSGTPVSMGMCLGSEASLTGLGNGQAWLLARNTNGGEPTSPSRHSRGMLA